MVLRAQGILVGFVLSLLAHPLPARADPISFLYRVDVVVGSGTLLPQPFVPTTFNVVATFDDQITSVEVDTGFRSERYGFVTFSPIPLFAPSPYPGVPFERFFPDSQNGFSGDSDGGFFHFGRVSQALGQESPNFLGCCVYDEFVVLEALRGGLTAPPILSPRTLGAFVGHRSDLLDFTFQFHAQKFDFKSAERLEEVSYAGFATFLREVSAPRTGSGTRIVHPRRHEPGGDCAYDKAAAAVAAQSARTVLGA